MASILKNVLVFGLTAGQSSAQAHLLNNNGVAKVPRNIYLDGAGYGVSADDTNVSITRGASAGSTVKVECEGWHSYEDCEPLPNGIATSLFPVVIQGGGSVGGAGGVAVAAGTQTATIGTVAISDSNGLIFGMSGSSQLTGRALSLIATSNEIVSINGSSNITMVAGTDATVSAGRHAALLAGSSINIAAAGGAISVKGTAMTIGADQQLSIHANSSGISMHALSSGITANAPHTNGVFAVSVGSQVQLLAGTGADLQVDNANGVQVQAKTAGKLGFYGVAAITRAALSSSSDLTAWVSRIATLLNALGLASTV